MEILLSQTNRWHHEVETQSTDSHISNKVKQRALFRKLGKTWQNLSSAAVMIGALRVKTAPSTERL